MRSQQKGELRLFAITRSQKITRSTTEPVVSFCVRRRQFLLLRIDNEHGSSFAGSILLVLTNGMARRASRKSFPFAIGNAPALAIGRACGERQAGLVVHRTTAQSEGVISGEKPSKPLFMNDRLHREFRPRHAPLDLLYIIGMPGSDPRKIAPTEPLRLVLVPERPAPADVWSETSVPIAA